MPKIKIKNLSAEINRRIRFIKTPSSVVDIGEQNGAVVESADYVGVCLAPAIQISCDDAINTATGTLLLRDGAPPEKTDETIVYYDGLGVPVGSQPPEWWKVVPSETPFPYPIPEGFSVFTTVQFSNLGNDNHRIEFDTKTDDVLVYIYDNPSAVQIKDDNTRSGACLSAAATVPIGCEGATTEIYFPFIGGEWNIELDGVLYETHSASIGYFIRSTFSDILDCFDDGFMRLVNKDFLPHRIKFISVQDTGYTAPEDNPTFIAHPDGSLTFCLAEKGIPLGCEGATSVLNFERLIGGNYSFGAVDEENNRYEYVAGTVDDIRTWLDNNSFVELTLNNDGFGYFTYTGTTYKKFYIIMLNDGEMSIPTGNPTVTHIVGEQGYQWCAFSSVEPPWDVEYILNGENFRELTGDPIPFDYMTSSQATELTINNTITTIQNRAFAFWLNAKKLYLPDSLTTVSHDVFKDWNSLIDIKIPNSVKTIGISCFTNAQSATIVDIGNSVESIGDNSFNNLYSCQKIILRSQTPPALGNASVFSGIPPSCLFYVPVGCIDAYVSSGQFGDGSLIREFQD